ncbi:methyltransferase-like protein 13 [Gossypium australe]|uniref:Methyltransferase-like protein 13 n=1 Tax=Gossypium australe TaxID=47621 RepID=A0A5B6V322_9ROSI|nr:methyltransferase-like protein 13 [Gossypium australe]
MDTAQNPDSDHKKTDLPSSASAYLDPNYWNRRFSNEEHYEWFKDYSHFRHLMQSHIKPNSSVLELGCGNSQLCEELYKDGITDITCIDLSSVAVERMKERLLSKGYEGVFCGYFLNSFCFLVTSLSEIKVLEADMLDLPFSNECFDVVIEKGTMDVLFVDSGDPWNPQPTTISKVMAMLEGVHKVLKPNGIFISITFGQPHFRKPFFHNAKFTWSVEWSTFGDGFHYFFYILRKGRRSLDDEDSIEKIQMPSISLYHEELEGEDYIFRTNIEELNS